MRNRQYTIVQTESHPTVPTASEIEDLKRLGAHLVVLERCDNKRVAQAVSTCDAILCATFELTRELLASARQLRIVARLGTGVDNIDVEAATELGIPVTNVPDFATEDVAQHTIALILACAKAIPVLDNAVRAGDWDVRQSVRLQHVDDKTLGLVGFGRIGRAVARYAVALGMRVVAYDPFLGPEDGPLPAQAERVEDLETLLGQSDFVSLHTPLTALTEHLISRRELSLMRSSAFLINCGRGALIDEGALVEAIQSGTIAGAGLDTLEQEPPPADSPVLNCSKIIVTPHSAAHTERSLLVLRQTAIKSILDALQGEWPGNVVNPEVRERWQERFAPR